MHWRRERTALYLYQAQNQAQSQGNRSEGRNAMAAAKALATVKDTGKPARAATDPARPTGRDAGDAVLVGWDGQATSATSAAMVNSSFIQGFRAG